METFIRFCDRLSQTCGILAGIMMLAGLVLVLTEILIRKLFNSTLYITEEYMAYLMVAITFLALAYTLKEKGHIRLVFLHSVLQGKARIALDIFAFTVGFAIFAVITVTTANFFWDSVVTQSRSMQISKTLLAIPQFVMPLGSLVMTIQFAGEITRSILQLRSANYQEHEVESGALGR